MRSRAHTLEPLIWASGPGARRLLFTANEPMYDSTRRCNHIARTRGLEEFMDGATFRVSVLYFFKALQDVCGRLMDIST